MTGRPSPTNLRRGLLVLGVVIGSFLIALRFEWRHRQGSPAPLTSPDARSGTLIGTGRPAQNGAETNPLRNALAKCQQTLASRPYSAGVQAALDELARNLHAVPADQASAAIRAYLDTHQDASTAQSFRVGPGGILQGAPTLRTFLLDQLGQLDPAGGAAYARTILGSMDSADEWALALRNLLQGESGEESRALGRDRLQAMLRHPAWVEQPSTGFLEAFDTAVYLRGTELIPTLGELVRRQDNPAVARAAYLALDRLTILDATATLSALEAQPELMQGREATRANYFARTDVRDEAQRTVLEKYLLNPALDPAELAKFMALFPNANYMVSHNLLTPTPTPDHAWLAARDRATMEQIARWQQDPRFAALAEPLRDVQRRLQSFVRGPSRE